MARDLSLTGVEKHMEPQEIIVTKTDLTGKITYGNRTFYKYAGYGERECLGVQHNLIRHPEMPRAVFKLLWDTLESGEEIFAYVNNRSRNGDNYWVLAHVTPSRDASGNVIGYHSNRRAPNRALIDQHIVPLYRRLLEVESRSSSKKEGLEQSTQAVTDLLQSVGMSYNRFFFSLGT